MFLGGLMTCLGFSGLLMVFVILLSITNEPEIIRDHSDLQESVKRNRKEFRFIITLLTVSSIQLSLGLFIIRINI